MATSKKNKAIRITSPVGTAKWVFVDKPSTKFKPEGEYSVQVVFSKKDIAAIGKQLAAEAKKAQADAIENAEKAIQKKARAKYELVYGLSPEQDDEGEATGNYVLKVKRDAQYTSSKTGETVNVTIPVFDAKKKPIKGAKIGSGSLVKVAFDAVPFCADGLKKVGMTLRLVGVQVIELVEWKGGATADNCGFGEEDGYEAGDDEGAEATPFDADEKGEDEEEAEEEEAPAKGKKGKAAPAKGKGKAPAKGKGKAPAEDDAEDDSDF
jgi:hypothetical protein